MTISFFLSGIFAATFAASGLFFLKFWKASRDPFFLNFAIACWLLVIERITAFSLDSVLQIATYGSENLAWVYLIRLSSFGFIIYAILKKNRAKSN